MLLSVSFRYFFFFKQKTAYEMRISDWSSDVCSSDLQSDRRSPLSGSRFRSWSLQPTHKLLEQIEAVLRPRACLGVVLHAERLLARDADAAIRSVEQALVRFDHARGERRGVDREAVVHAGDLDHAVFGPLHRVVGAAMALVHLDRLRADGDAQHLVAEADAEQRNVAVEQALDEDRKSTRLNSSH